MLLINCEVNLTLTWSSTCVITNSTGAGRFAITETKLLLKIMQKLRQLTRTNISQIQKHMHKTDI